MSQIKIGSSQVALILGTTGHVGQVEYSVNRVNWQDGNAVIVPIPPMQITVFVREKIRPGCETAIVVDVLPGSVCSTTITGIRWVSDVPSCAKYITGYRQA
ncbi:hypothetical protein EQG79_00465 [Spirosoma sordidisoli]|uniref:Uncharacterized protein n=1 Tax=Spirosoma sordidisoli TaxID=2502893 RepID=A0A4Q2UM26_9BACT|nr:hypothetical protein EQG79_00465 [Spirosoma sordidisoli]